MNSIVLDTNIFIRFIINEIPLQYTKSKTVFEQIENNEIKTVVSILVINEMIWILENYYNLQRSVFIPQIKKLFALSGIVVEEMKKSDLVSILDMFQNSTFDFTDLYIATIASDRKIYSFDRDFDKIQKRSTY